MDKTSAITALASPYVWIYSTMIGLFLVFVWMVLVNVTFMYSVWPEGAGLQTITAILEHDTLFAPQPLANRLADWSYATLFKFSGIDGLLVAATTPDAKLSALDATLVNGFLLPHTEGIAIFMQSVRLVGIRFAIVVDVLAIILPLLAAALVDGLVQRHVRRECAGRESSSLYHRAKYFQLVGWLLVTMMYVTMPINIDPRWLFAWATIAALLIFVQTKFYKKYL